LATINNGAEFLALIGRASLVAQFVISRIVNFLRESRDLSRSFHCFKHAWMYSSPRRRCPLIYHAARRFSGSLFMTGDCYSCQPLSWTTDAVWCSQDAWCVGVERRDAWQINCWYRISHAQSHTFLAPHPWCLCSASSVSPAICSEAVCFVILC